MLLDAAGARCVIASRFGKPLNEANAALLEAAGTPLELAADESCCEKFPVVQEREGQHCTFENRVGSHS